MDKHYLNGSRVMHRMQRTTDTYGRPCDKKGTIVGGGSGRIFIKWDGRENGSTWEYVSRVYLIRD